MPTSSPPLAKGESLAPAKNLAQMHQIIFNDYVDATLTAMFIAVVVAMLVFSVNVIRKALAVKWVTTTVPAAYRRRSQCLSGCAS
jgi:carbon starvation protein